jgi:hypothetical protein
MNHRPTPTNTDTVSETKNNRPDTRNAERRALSAICCLLTAGLAFGAIPLVSSPSWSSTSNDYSTGAGFWDIDTNGCIDFCMSNGNDMALDYNAVYFNSGGALENTASWRSSDNGNYGHLYLGDINNDDLMDMAVAYLGPSGDHRARIYKNTGGTLTTSPWWKSKDTTTFFDCCLGDVNNDGYLDLAISAGDAYGSLKQPYKIYFNQSGTLDTLPGWRSTNLVQSDAVRLADLNNDGKLDLIGDGKGFICVYYQRGDTFERLPSWVDTAGNNTMGTRLAVGDYDNDGWLDLAAVQNGQMGGTNQIRVYHNNSGTLTKPPAYRLQRRNTYSSCVAWGDVNNDGYLDLAAGGWWEPVVVYENRAGVLDTAPGWSWRPSSSQDLVCETVVWGDLRNRYLVRANEAASGNGARKLFYLRHMPFQEFQGVEVNSVPVPRADYCFDPLTGCVSLRDAPPAGTDNVVFRYAYSEHPDLGLTNWEPSDHNYVFLNTAPTGIADRARPVRPARLRAFPTHFSGALNLEVEIPRGALGSIHAYAADGRAVGTVAADLSTGSHRLCWPGAAGLTPGVYFVKLSCSNGMDFGCKVIRIN